MRVLLVNPSYPFEEFPRLLVTLPYLAAALRADGHEVEILDLLLARTTPAKIERRMERFRPQIVGITSVTLNHHIASRIGEVVRKCDEEVPIVMGGPHVSFEVEGSFRDLGALDFIGINEGEHTMVELVRALEGRMDLRDVRGLALRDRSTGRIERTAPRPLEDDLDELAPPARDLVPLARYLAFDSHASVVTSRGCPYECIFCSAPARTGRKVRYRDPSLCVDEIEEIVALGFGEITIEDDLFTLYRKHFLAVCGELARRDTGIRWNGFSRVDTITPEIVETMARAGCQAICFGVESGNQEILDLAKKHSSLARVREAMRMTQAAGISALASFIIGLPGETAETLRETFEFAESLRQEFGSLYGFHVLAPFPTTTRITWCRGPVAPTRLRSRPRSMSTRRPSSATGATKTASTRRGASTAASCNRTCAAGASCSSGSSCSTTPSTPSPPFARPIRSPSSRSRWPSTRAPIPRS
jgi:radical SAM superfamily enzyme YgiQ (UPF0313 family)